MLEYITNLGWLLLWYYPFAWIMGLICSIIMIPLSVLGKFPTYIICSIQNYLICLYFAVATLLYSTPSGLSPIPFVIISCLCIFFTLGSKIKTATDHSFKNFFSFSSYIFVFVYLAMYFTKFLAGYNIMIAYSELTHKILSIPLIGELLNFSLPFVSFILLVFTIFAFASYVFSIIGGITASARHK